MVAITEGAEFRFELGRVIQRTFGVLRRNLVPFFGAGLVLIAIPYTAMNWGSQHVAQDSAFNLLGLLMAVLGWFVSLVGGFVLQAAIVHGTVADLNGKRVSLASGLSTGLRFFFPLLGLGVLMGLGYMLGILLLVVPGLILMVMWSVAAPALVVERCGVTGAMGRSRALTKGVRWQIFALGLVYMILVYGTMFGLGQLKLVVFSAAQGITLVQAACSALFSCLVSVVGAAGVAALYYELRASKEGVGAESLAAVFD